MSHIVGVSSIISITLSLPMIMKWSQIGTYLLHMITAQKIVFQKGADLGL